MYRSVVDDTDWLFIVDHFSPITGENAKKVKPSEHLCQYHKLTPTTEDKAKYLNSINTYLLLMFHSDKRKKNKGKTIISLSEDCVPNSSPLVILRQILNCICSERLLYRFHDSVLQLLMAFPL